MTFSIIGFPRQQWLRELRHTYIACLVDT